MHKAEDTEAAYIKVCYLKQHTDYIQRAVMSSIVQYTELVWNNKQPGVIHITIIQYVYCKNKQLVFTNQFPPELEPGANCCELHLSNCTLHTAHCTMQTAHCTLHTAQCRLQTAHCTMHTAYYTHDTAHHKVSPQSIDPVHLYTTYRQLTNVNTFHLDSRLGPTLSCLVAEKS